MMTRNLFVCVAFLGCLAPGVAFLISHPRDLVETMAVCIEQAYRTGERWEQTQLCQDVRDYLIVSTPAKSSFVQLMLTAMVSTGSVDQEMAEVRKFQESANRSFHAPSFVFRSTGHGYINCPVKEYDLNGVRNSLLAPMVKASQVIQVWVDVLVDELIYKHGLCQTKPLPFVKEPANLTVPRRSYDIPRDLTAVTALCLLNHRRWARMKICQHLEQTMVTSRRARFLLLETKAVTWTLYPDMKGVKEFKEEAIRKCFKKISFVKKLTSTGYRTCHNSAYDLDALKSCLNNPSKRKGSLWNHWIDMIVEEVRHRDDLCDLGPQNVGWSMGYKEVVFQLLQCVKLNFTNVDGVSCSTMEHNLYSTEAKRSLSDLVKTLAKSSWKPPQDFYEKTLRRCLDTPWTVQTSGGQRRSCPKLTAVVRNIRPCLSLVDDQTDDVTGHKTLLSTLASELEWRHDYCTAQNSPQSAGWTIGFHDLMDRMFDCAKNKYMSNRFCLHAYQFFHHKSRLRLSINSGFWRFYNLDNYKKIVDDCATYNWTVKVTETGLKTCPNPPLTSSDVDTCLPWNYDDGTNQLTVLRLRRIVYNELSWRATQCQNGTVPSDGEGWVLPFGELMSQLVYCGQQKDMGSGNCSTLETKFDSPAGKVAVKVMFKYKFRVLFFDVAYYYQQVLQPCIRYAWAAKMTSHGLKSCPVSEYDDLFAECVNKPARDYPPEVLTNVIIAEMVYRHKICNE